MQKRILHAEFLIHERCNSLFYQGCEDGVQEAEGDSQGVQKKGRQIVWQYDFQTEQD